MSSKVIKRKKQNSKPTSNTSVANRVQSQWISVKDRLPKSDTWVLVYVQWDKEVDPDDSENSYIFVAKYDLCDDCWWDDSSEYDSTGWSDTPTHWQPLPDKPQHLCPNCNHNLGDE